jgi:EmrB/QacA subfamily drug resistance transporter
MTNEFQAAADSGSRWGSFAVLCLGTLVVILDGTVVNVALPSIKADLLFSEASLVWVINAYILTFSGFLLLGGRLSDFFGQRKLFLFGIALFTAASAACGLANTQALLIGARAIQGLGGAVVSSVSLSLTVSLFAEGPERAKAMGIYSFVGLFGGAFGLVLGGTLTGLLNWHWIFLVNLPLGVAIYALCLVSLPESPDHRPTGQLDIAGAVAVTMSSGLAVYAIVGASDAGWSSAQTLILLASSAGLLILFLYIEAGAPAPLVPLDIFRRRNLTVACVIYMLWPFTTWGWFLIAALYMQVVLKCSPEQIGLAFLPANLAAAAISLGLSARLVERFGIKRILSTGLLFTAAGFALFARAPVDGSVAFDVLPAMLLDGVGSGLACSPMLLAVTSGTPPAQSGLVSGVVNTAAMMAGALGLAVLATAASAHTNFLVRVGVDLPLALDSGYHLAFAIGAILLVVASLMATALLRIEQ